jgi:hypothetical protein
MNQTEQQLPTLTELHQQLWTEARTHRNQLLKQADIEINRLEDGNQDATSLRSYRQSLRDLPTSTEDPTGLVWPVKPI